MSRGDLSEAEWRLLRDLLPAERGRKSRPAGDNRPIVNGILWRIRTGAAFVRLAMIRIMLRRLTRPAPCF